MTSRRPRKKPANIDFSHEALADCFFTEPQRGQSTVADMEKTALGSTTTNLIERVVAWDNMLKAWKAVRANRGAPGPDGIAIDDFPEHFYQHWPTIRRQLLEGTYEPGASRRKSIPKKDGGERNLSIPNVMERLIQQAVSTLVTFVLMVVLARARRDQNWTMARNIRGSLDVLSLILFVPYMFYWNLIGISF